MNVGTPYSQAARDAALTAIGGDSFPENIINLLQQCCPFSRKPILGCRSGGSSRKHRRHGTWQHHPRPPSTIHHRYRDSRSMTTVGTLYSSTARTTALDSIGGNSFDSTIPGLLQQAIVAVGNNGGGGGGSTAWGAITGKPTNVVAFGDLTNAAGALTNNGSGTLSYVATTAGGNGEADAGKLPLITANGGLTLGNTAITDGTILTLRTGVGNGISVAVDTLGMGVYSELNGSTSQAFHAHVTAGSTGSQTGFDADMTGGTGANFAVAGLVNPDGVLLYGREFTGGVGRDRLTISATGALTWYKDGSTFFSGTDKTTLGYATPAGTNTITIPAETGTMALRGANTFTALQQFTGTTHAGLRLNNLTTVERDAIASPQAGMCIWNTTAARLQLHNGSAWTAGMVRLDGDTMTGALAITQGAANTGVFSSTGYSLTGSNATNAFDIAGTLNTSGNPSVMRVAMTTTAAGSTTALARWLGTTTGAANIFAVLAPVADAQASAAIQIGAGLFCGEYTASSSFWFGMSNNKFAGKFAIDTVGASVANNGYYAFGGDNFANSSVDLVLRRRASAWLGLGTAAASPIEQTLSGCDGLGTNVTGGILNISAGRGTGTGIAGVLNFRSHAAAASGSTVNATPVNVLSIIRPGVIRITGIPTSSAGLSAGDVYSNAGILTIV